MRLWPRSIRARDTLIATLISVLVLGAAAVGVDATIRYQIRAQHRATVERVGTRIGMEYREGLLPRPIPAVGGIGIQVVDAKGHVIARTLAKDGLPLPISRLRPTPDEGLRTWSMCPAPGGGCLLINATLVWRSADSPVVYTCARLPWPLDGRRLEAWIAAALLGLVLGTAGVTWVMVGRTLRPIERIRVTLAGFTGADLSGCRLPVPRGEHEIALLARTANDMLDRLERATEQQHRFSSDASHELRTPIAGLRAQLESALMYPEDTDLLATIKSALRDTDRLEAIVGDLLLLARLGTGTKVLIERIDLSEMVSAEMEVRSGRSTVGLDLQPKVVVNGARIQLLRVLSNLLDNADRYGEGVTDVTVYTRHGTAVLTVTDRGPGIPPADRERVFERFTRLDSARSRTSGGTGLGLAIARDIAAAHQGTLRIEDSPVGTRFVLRLPLADDE